MSNNYPPQQNGNYQPPPIPGTYQVQPGFPPPPPPKISRAGVIILTIIAILTIITVFTIGIIYVAFKTANSNVNVTNKSDSSAHPTSSITKPPSNSATIITKGSNSPTSDTKYYASDYLKDSYKPATIINDSATNEFDCITIARANKAWVPGGWTLRCVDKLNPKDVHDADTAGITYPDKKEIDIANRVSNESIQSVMIHEIGHSYDFTYFSQKDEDNIAADVHHSAKDYWSDDYTHSPAEMWARGFSYCRTGLKVDFTLYPPLSCNYVEKTISDIKDRLGIDLDYIANTAPKVSLNNRKNY